VARRPVARPYNENAMKKLPMILAAVSALAALPAHAEGLRPGGWFASVGVSPHSTQSVTAGVSWPWEWQRSFGWGRLEGRTEAYVSAWNAPGLSGGRRTLAQVGIVPLLRLRLDGGRSPWFGEMGIGLSWTSSIYRTPSKQFSTSFNFHDTIGVGYSFGANGSREVGLRVVHFSNAGISHPNPGIEFVQLRYASSF
jgi:lipid A 3-O-deacylase